MSMNRDLSKKASTQHTTLDRRDVLKGLAIAAGGSLTAGISASPVLAAAPKKTSAANSDASVIARDGDAIANTAAGKVAGYVRNSIFTFKGIPYGDTTEGANRFMPPQKPKPWTGVRSSRQHGPVAPQAARAGWANDEESFMFSWDDGIQGEDCLRLNLWTPSLNDGKKRPVMVWLHGGGYAA